MSQAVSKSRSSEGSRPTSSSNAIPRRPRQKAVRNTTIPPQPSIRRHTIRLAFGAAIGCGVMLALLMLAVKYAQRDWVHKQQQAWALRIVHPEPDVKEEPGPLAEGWRYLLQPSATDRELGRLGGEMGFGNGWLILGRALSDREMPAVVLASLRMALASGGEAAAIYNDMGAVHLQQRQMRQAAAKFEVAVHLQPGFAPALFNLALCAIAERQPAKASRLLSHYLARRSDDVAAYRLQATLLTQLGRSEEALWMLEKFLRGQPSSQPLFLEAAVLAARLGRHGNAIRYLETAIEGNAIQAVVRAYQSPSFREIRLSEDGTQLAGRLAARARVAYGAPMPVEDIVPLRGDTPGALIR